MIVAQAFSLAKGMEPVPGYRLSQFLGKGGWGSVWKATNPAGNDCALKFLPCDHQPVAAQEIRALQAIRQLKHPHLLGIEQIWSMPRYLVIAMELAEGSLLDLLDVYYAEYNQPIVAEHLCFYLRQAASALDFLNARQHLVNGQRVGFRHCDVKPSNLLLLGKTVKLADFSLAVQASSPICNHRKVGTLNYCAPEIFQGLLSDKSDQFSLAVTYCHLRCGRLPFPDPPANAAISYVRPAPDLRGLSPDERPIVARALTPVPQDRWHTCIELIQNLERAQETNVRFQESAARVRS
jgi:serine/threonine protein kinase